MQEKTFMISQPRFWCYILLTIILTHILGDVYRLLADDEESYNRPIIERVYEQAHFTLPYSTMIVDKDTSKWMVKTNNKNKEESTKDK